MNTPTKWTGGGTFWRVIEKFLHHFDRFIFENLAKNYCDLKVINIIELGKFITSLQLPQFFNAFVTFVINNFTFY